MIDKYNAKDEYSETGFWKKVLDFSSKAGKSLIKKVLLLFYVLKDDDTPPWAKTVIYGALGYFILPLDGIPDFIPYIGFSDDLTAIVTALTLVSSHIKKEHKQKADEKLNNWFK